MSSILLTGVGNKASIGLAAGGYFIRDVYEHPNLTGLTATTKFNDGTEPDTTTDESNPAGAASGTDPHVMTCFLVWSAPVTFDTAKIVPGYTEQLAYVLAYSMDGTTWTNFTGVPPVQGLRAGTYGAGSQLEQTTTAASLRVLRISVSDEIFVASPATKVGLFDARLYLGVTERVVV